MSPHAICLAVCLIFAAIGFGCWMGERDANKKPRDHRQPFRYWRP